MAKNHIHKILYTHFHRFINKINLIIQGEWERERQELKTVSLSFLLSIAWQYCIHNAKEENHIWDYKFTYKYIGAKKWGFSLSLSFATTTTTTTHSHVKAEKLVFCLKLNSLKSVLIFLSLTLDIPMNISFSTLFSIFLLLFLESCRYPLTLFSSFYSFFLFLASQFFYMLNPSRLYLFSRFSRAKESERERNLIQINIKIACCCRHWANDV